MNDDHDLLLTFKAEVSTKLDRVISDVKELKDNVAARVSALEEEKTNKKDFDQYTENTDKKIDVLSRLVYIGLGIVIALNFAILAYINYYHK